jgi:hypothetical protein
MSYHSFHAIEIHPKQLNITCVCAHNRTQAVSVFVVYYRPQTWDDYTSSLTETTTFPYTYYKKALRLHTNIPAYNFKSIR